MPIVYMMTDAGCRMTGTTVNLSDLREDWLPFLQGVADDTVFQDRGVGFPPYPWEGQGCPVIKSGLAASG